MKRRIFALMLTLAMLCPVILTGCSGGTGGETTSSLTTTTTRETVTITMWVVTDKNTTEEAKAAVEEEFNRITKSTYTTAVDLIFVSPDEYVEALNNKFAQAEEAKKAASSNTVATTTAEGETTEKELETNEYGVSVLKYPEVTDDQIDIVYIQGFDHLYDLVKGGAKTKLMNLNEHISATGRAKILTDVISDPLFKYSKIDKGTYGIPNNRVVGEYTYLLVNKDLVTGDANGDGTVSADEINGAYFNFSDISDFFDCEEIIEYIKANRTDMVPVLEEFDNPYIHYWGDNGQFSILASKSSVANQTADANAEYIMKNVFTVKEFTEFELLMKKYETNGYFASDVTAAKTAQNFGVAVMKGDSAIIDEYGDNYYVKVIASPALTNENLFTSFFGITEDYCKNVERALEILTMINTDSELRNVLQYGVEGVHYEIDEDDRVHRFNNDYIMNLEDTGNVFVAYPEEDMDEDAWVRGVASNLDLRIDPLTGLWSDWLNVDAEILANLKTQSETFKQRLDACKTVEELQTFFETVKTEVDENEAFKAAIDTSNEKSPKSVYSKWYTTNWPASEV